jgi:hypothetical protein
MSMPTPNDKLSTWLTELSRKEFLETVDSRIGGVGALLELRDAALFRVTGYSIDDWGARIRIMHVPMAGFRSARTGPIEISSSWDGFSTTPERWQARYCWKFLFGEVEIETAIAAAAEAAARGLLLSCNQVHQIFNWYKTLEERKQKDQGCTDLPCLMELLFNPPARPVPPAAGTTPL